MRALRYSCFSLLLLILSLCFKKYISDGICLIKLSSKMYFCQNAKPAVETKDFRKHATVACLML